VKSFSNFIPRAVSRRKSVLLAGAAAVAAVVGFSGVSARAATVLTDGNSSIALNGQTVGSWLVNGTNQLNLEEFFFRVGSSGGQTPISNPTMTKLLDTNGNGLNDTVKYTYGTTSGFQVVATYSLTGGQTGSGTSDVTESLKITNVGMTSQTFHLFEYTNFNLDDLTSGQTVTITGGNTATDIGDGVDAQAVVSPKPGEFEASNTAASPDLLANISSTTKAYTLKDVASAPAGDGEWAFEWDLSIGCDSTAVINIDKNIKVQQVAEVPEPTPGVIAMLGLGGLFMIRPRRGAVAI
jgi:MYXO-CTERM domain-containing protein